MRSNLFDSGYIRLATIPPGDTSFTDIVPVSGENHYYYLELISSEDKPLKTATVFAAYTEEGAAPEPPEKVDATPDPNGIKVYWNYSEPFVKGFYVYRKRSNSSVFVQASPLIPVGGSVYSFADTSALIKNNEIFAYVVKAISEDNQLSQNSDTVFSNSGKKINLTPPMNLRFRNDNGIITIIWDDMRIWNADLLGYKVLGRSDNAPFKELQNDSLSAEKNFYIDSSAKNNTSYTYAVVCLDIFGNRSVESEITIPAFAAKTLAPPADIQAVQTSDGVYISWGQLANDFKAINIYRSEAGKSLQQIKVVPDEDNFLDKAVEKGILYFYQLSAVGIDGREGELSGKVAIRLK